MQVTKSSTAHLSDSKFIFSDIQQINFEAPWLNHVVKEIRQRHLYENNEPLFTCLNHILRSLYPESLMTGQGKPLRFVAQSVLDDINTKEAMAYETLIADSGQVPTRDNLHDLFNAWVWLTFPKTKALLNRHQAEQITQAGISGSRGRVRDAITVLDENGAILITCDKKIATALKDFDWQKCLVEPREQWVNALNNQNNHHNEKPTTMVMLCGHALMEQLVEPRKPLCAHTFILHVEADFFSLSHLEQVKRVDELLLIQLDKWLQADDVKPRQLSPLPILGVPYFWHENADPDFYDDSYVFRSGRRQKK